MAPKRRQAIIWTNADLIHWRMYAALGVDELNAVIRLIVMEYYPIQRLCVQTTSKNRYTFKVDDASKHAVNTHVCGLLNGKYWYALSNPMIACCSQCHKVILVAASKCCLPMDNLRASAINSGVNSWHVPRSRLMVASRNTYGESIGHSRVQICFHAWWLVIVVAVKTWLLWIYHYNTTESQHSWTQI